MLHQIGAGVLGPVFRAYQPDPGRLVAIKQFRLDLGPETEARFVEALQQIVAADLTHQGIAAPIAAGLAESAPYLALDFVAAESFDVVMREYGPAQAREALRLARQVGSALDSAAAVGVLHGALHPRDLLMAADDVRVTGLGIAQALDSIGVTAPIRRPYTAPERAAGAPWDRRADTFGLAALVYEMLVGRPVTLGDDVADSLSAIDGCDADRLCAAFARGLNEDPAERFASARQFSDALDRALTPAASRAKSSATRRRRDVPPEREQLVAQLPLEAADEAEFSVVEADTADDTLEMSLLDAAVPLLENDNGHSDVHLEVGLSKPDLSEPDLDGVDSRLDAVPVPLALTDLDFRTIERGRREHTDAKSTVDVPTLRLDALDEATDAPPAVSLNIATRASDAANLFSERDTEELEREVAAAGSAYGTPFAHATPLGGGESQGGGNWPIYLGVVVGLLVGFAFGYSYGLWRVTGSVLSTGTTIASSERATQALPSAPRPQGPAIASVPAASAPAATAPAAAAPAAPADPAASRPGTSSAQTAARGASPSPRPAVPAAVPSTARGARAVSAPATPPPPPPPPSAQPPRAAADTRLVVRTTPAGARVTIDGRDAGITPLTTQGLAPGSHVVGLAHDGYVGTQRRVRIGAAQLEPIAVELVARPVREVAAPRTDPARASGSLVLDSRPAGARVFVDEALVGTTPMQIDTVAGGDHAVRFELDGFNKWSTTARVTAGVTTRVSGSLER